MKIDAEITQTGEGTPRKGKKNVQPVNPGQEYVYGHCFNKLCGKYNNRVPISVKPTIEKMIAECKKEGEVESVECGGHETEGARRRCINRFNTKIIIS